MTNNFVGNTYMVSFPNQTLVHGVLCAAGEWQCSCLESNRETLREPTCGGKEDEEEEGERGGVGEQKQLIW